MRRTTAVLLTALTLLGAFAGTASASSSKSESRKPQTVMAYYVHDNGSALHVVAEQRTLPQRTKGVARAAVQESLKAPKGKGLVTMAPAGTTVRGVNLRKGVLTIDLSKEVRRNPRAGADGERMFAQQLAHAAGQYDNVDAIRLWVEGKPVTELWGHLDWSKPVRPDGSVVAD
jgi:spore germination protein GerM